MKVYTNNEQVILASSSKTRIDYLKQHFNKVLVVQHKVQEKKIKNQYEKQGFTGLVKLLARKKAESIMEDFPTKFIIGSDQILVCEGKLLNKSDNLSKAMENLINLRGKKHTLISSTYVIRNKKFYFEETKEAVVLFKNVTQKKIENYLNEMKEKALMSVGSYRIEDNRKYNFLKNLKGDHETIIGFPLISLKNKFIKEIR